MRAAPGLCLSGLFAAASLAAQPVSAGLKAGVPLTRLLSAAPAGPPVETKRYTLGPMVELRLPRSFAVEIDMLFKRMEYGRKTAANRWELPLLVKRRFGRGRWNPFAGVGASFNWVTGARSGDPAELLHRSTKGVVTGAGVEGRLGRLRVSPELRFTRWADRNFGVRDAALRSELSQVEVLVGVAF